MVDLSVIIVSFNTKTLLRDCLESLTRAVRPNGEVVVGKAVVGKAAGGKAGKDKTGTEAGGKRAQSSSWTWSGVRLLSDEERLYERLAEKPAAEVVVVDNASTDGSARLVENEFPWVKLMRNRQNLGFAKANNRAIRQSSGRYILLLNPDTILSPRSLEIMVRYMDKYPRVAVSTCRVELPGGEIDPPSHRGFPTPWRALCHFAGLGKIFPRSRLFNGYYLGHLNPETIHEIDSPMGAFYLVRREAVEEVGLLDEDYFWYGEDLDWSYRFKEAGWKITYVPHVKILHYHGAASGVKETSRHLSTADRQTRRLAARESVRAMKLFYQKHYLDKYPRLVTKLVFWSLGFLESYRVRKWGGLPS
jgi:hypothetical protein